MAKQYEIRRYQQRAREQFKDWFSGSEQLATIILPTGTGKTATASMSLNEIFETHKGPVLWVAHREELIDQAVEALRAICVGRTISVEMGDRKGDPTADIIVGSVQTLARMRKHMEGFVPAIIIIDEYHHYSEDNVQYDGLIKRFPDTTKVLGLTATPYRFTGQNLPLGRILIQMDIGTAVEKGYLVPPKPEALNTSISLAEVKTRMGDFSVKDLSKVVNVDSRNQLIAKRIIELVRDAKRQGILFAVDVAHSKAMHEMLRNEVRAAEVYGETPTEERREIMARMRGGEIDVLLNNLVATEGFDVPHLSFVGIARPTRSLGLYTQCLDEQTEILTQCGWVSRTEITRKHLVAAFDQENNSIQWEPVIEIFDREIGEHEKMYELISPSVNIRVTGGHRMIYRTRSNKRRNKLSWQLTDCENLAQFHDQFEMPFAGIQLGSGVDLSDDELRFIGWFLTDGTINKTTKQIVITQKYNQPWINEIDKMLIGCGFKYTKNLVTPKSNFTDAPNQQYKYTISYGLPRGIDKHLTGWSKLEKYIDKNFSPYLEDINAVQLGILLEAIHLGDGDKQINQSWQRRSYHITTVNQQFANRLQSICIRRGYRCNISKLNNSTNHNILKIHIKFESTRMIGSAGTMDRSRLQLSAKTPNERVWCVQNKLGTLVTRRNGKSVILGNCVGRGLRTFPGKTDCIVIDVCDKIKIKQNRVLFVDMAVAGDLSGERKRATNILKAPVELDPVANSVKNFPIFLNKEKVDRWTADEERFTVSSWMITTDQWIVTWSAETKEPAVTSKAVLVPWETMPPAGTDLTGRDVHHATFGAGKVKKIVDRTLGKILVSFGWDTEKLLMMSSLKIQKFIKEHSPDQFEIKKIERLFYICLPDVSEAGRIMSFVRKGRDLVLIEDQRKDQFQIDTYLQEQAVKDGILQLVRCGAKWKSGAASEKQIEFVRRMIQNSKIGFDLDLENLTKGEASSVIEQAKWQELICQKFGTNYKEKLLGYDNTTQDV